ncbi:monovalent cation/H+ antiporter complex subunit F [Luteococcus peritonei]|uniref:Monovalent cation/H+ antiporter complex subunit F n=1 Tax=Luteococcus peritonei TaxID=88874 RepID=A0ABW4RXW4_9ACTN
MITIIWWACGILLACSALLAVTRMVVGPTVLNRALANDVLVSVLVCALGLEAVAGGHVATLPILITLSLLGFVSTVAISRFVARDVDEDFTSSDDPLPARPERETP